MADVPPQPERPLRPVGWLLAPELLAQLRTILHRRRNDPRDWMPVVPGHAHVEDGAPDAGRVRDIRITAVGGGPEEDAAEGEAPPPRVVPPERGELWFDYIADTGDGGAAMFTMAYLLQAELRLDETAGDRDRTDGAAVIVAGAPGDGPATLPRGQFCVFGGDTAYHVADQATLAARVRAPFAWAARALAKRGAVLAPRRRLYGIPGNHDWYDDLDGFGAMFRRDLPGVVGRPRLTWLAALFGLGDRGEHGPSLDLAGYERVQTASYLAIELPWDWQLWGLDVDIGLDPRQELYFRSLPRTTKLVVCTGSPALALGAMWCEPAHRDALERLDLPAYFDEGAAPPPPGACRLDLAGDIHHYARYQPDDTSYASVVAGLGGAFHHPTFPQVGDRVAQATFPEPAASRRAVARHLFNPVWLFRGGLIRIVPLAFCFFLAAAATSATGTGWLFDHMLGWVGIEHEAGVWNGPVTPLPEREGVDVLSTSAWFLGAIIAGIALILFGLSWAGRVAAAHARDPDRKRSFLEVKRAVDVLDPMRSYWLAWVLGVAGFAMPFVVPVALDFDAPGAIWFDVVFYLLVVTTFAGGAIFGAVFGARRHRWPRRIALGVLGFIHGAAQLFTPFVIARIALATWWAVPAMIAVTALGLPFGRHLFARGGTGSVIPLAAAGFLFAALTLVVATYAADGVAVEPHGVYEYLVVWVGGALLAMFFGCALFGWYLAIAGALDGHFNEIAAAALVDRYRQFIRFRLTPDGLTGYVIGVDQVSMDPAALRPRVVDRFEIAPR
ncbi:MAG TPA: hypothetical protein VM261_38600 [Kofleriaceae bacterium]|nr:hypothetical protein [Kofleriaceae bacterium]